MIPYYALFNESFPEHPNTMVIKNQFYPSGLKEKDIYSYYIRNKRDILNQIKNRELMFLIFTDVNNFVVRKKQKLNTPIILNNSNYEHVITGRTVSIHSTMKSNENMGIIDIDYDNFKKSKEIVKDVYNTLLNYYKQIEIRFTGKNSFHLVVYFNRKNNIDNIRKELLNILDKEFRDKYLINSQKRETSPNLDLSPNKKGGNFIFPRSLSQLGLKCMTIDLNYLDSFRKQDAKIK